MTERIETISQLQEEIDSLRFKLEQTEEALRAIQSGEVDALVINTPNGDRVYTLQDSDEPYRVMLETMNEGAATVLKDGTILYCNHRLAEMIGVPLEQLLGGCLFNYIVGSGKDKFSQTVSHAIKVNTRLEASLACKNGTFLPVLISLKSLLINDEHRAACVIVTDQTDQKHNLDMLEEMVAQRTAALMRSNKDLEDFTSTISHDLQEPLRKIQAFGKLLNASTGNVLTEEELDYIRRMQDASHRMSDMVEGLLTVSRISKNHQELDTVDLNEVVQTILENLENSIQKTKGKIEVGQLPVIQAERYQIHQLFQNLIGNALKFHKNGVNPRVVISSRQIETSKPNSPLAQISIQDNGIGFDESYLEQLFQPFRRLVGRSEYEGTGLGLTIARKIVERHGGRITARSKLGEGSTFIFTLPIQQD